MLEDRFNALVPHGQIAIAGSAGGPLAGLTFVVKDFFDVAGVPTGAGSPDWLATHPVPAQSAPVVRRLLEAGATLVGKTHTDEMAWSLNGENHHYGTPVNPAAPDRIPGGSSSGSAVIAAAGLTEFSIGSDTGGSVRLPASYCGAFGMRPTHGRVDISGAVPLAPSYDSVGWFARDGVTMKRVAAVLFDEWHAPAKPPRFLLATDLFEAAGHAVTQALQQAVANLGAAQPVDVAQGDLPAWRNVFRVIQASEVWEAHGVWVQLTKPSFGPGIRERFEGAPLIPAEEVLEARALRARVRAHLDALLGDDGVLILPTAPGAAPLRGAPAVELETFRARCLELLCLAGHAGLPQMSMPLASIDDCPLGLSLIAPRGQDERLLDIAATLSSSMSAVPALSVSSAT